MLNVYRNGFFLLCVIWHCMGAVYALITRNLVSLVVQIFMYIDLDTFVGHSFFLRRRRRKIFSRTHIETLKNLNGLQICRGHILVIR